MTMKRTISGMIGEGSISHNERKFIAHNVDASRTAENLVLTSEDIKEVYHELFDEALERYNLKQSRKDRKIENYYEHIRTGRQEKLFHEVIFQIGNKDDTGCLSDEGQIAKSVLVEFAKEFQTKNPQFRVFGLYLHMDEATPHLHIDFVPYMTGSKRGLDTRVSLKQALESRGFKGKSKSETEWNQWMESEKEELAKVAERYDIQWEKKGTHKEHLSVLDFKKEMRIQEVKDLEQKKDELLDVNDQLVNQLGEIYKDKQIAKEEEKKAREKVDAIQEEVNKYEKKLENLQPFMDNISKELDKLDGNIEEQLPTAGILETGLSYREKKAKPLFLKMKNKISSLAAMYVKAKQELKVIKITNKKLVEENKDLKEQCRHLLKEKESLKEIKGWFESVIRVLGREKVQWAVDQDMERIKREAKEKMPEGGILARLEWSKKNLDNQKNIKKKHKEMEL